VVTTFPAPSLGKYKESIYSVFQAFLTDTNAGPSATIQIQATDDALTAYGVTIPLLLTNGSPSIAVPTTGYTLTVLDGNGQPTGQRTVSTNTPVNMYTVPIDRTTSVWSSPFTQIDQGIVSLKTGMLVGGLGPTNLSNGTTLSTITAGGLAGTLSSSWVGTTGVYLVNFSNPYWASTLLGTITLTGGAASYASDGFSTAAAWKYVRANVTALTGSNPQLQVWMGA
jgi:hypothetical protein